MTIRQSHLEGKTGSWQACSANPEKLLEFRQRAFAAGDFGQVWDCYHPASNFRRAFPDREAYEEYGRTRLAVQFVLTGWRLLQQETDADLARVLVLSSFTRDGQPNDWYEWIRLQRVGQGWAIVEIARLERHLFPGPAESMDWREFERLSDMVFF